MATSGFHRRAGSSMLRQYVPRGVLSREVDLSAFPSVTTSPLGKRDGSPGIGRDLTPTVKALAALVIILSLAILGTSPPFWDSHLQLSSPSPLLFRCRRVEDWRMEEEDAVEPLQPTHEPIRVRQVQQHSSRKLPDNG